MRYLKDNWPHLILTLIGSVFSTAFALGFAWAVFGNRVANAERRLDEIEATHIQETSWQVEQDTAAISAIQQDNRRTESSIAQINTRLGVIDAKLDAIAETLRRRP
jgi:hypothetical protein